MDSLQSLIKKAHEFKMEGYSEKDIAVELNINQQTAAWLINRATKGVGDKPPVDASVGWRTLGVFPHRLHSVAEIMVDVIAEEVKDIDKVDAIVAVPVNSVPLSTMVALGLEKELIIFKFPDEDEDEAEGPQGSIYSNYAGVDGKTVVVVDDVLGTGKTMRTVIGGLREHGADVILSVVMVNKSPDDTVDGVPLRGLFRVKVIG